MNVSVYYIFLYTLFWFLYFKKLFITVAMQWLWQHIEQLVITVLVFTEHWVDRWQRKIPVPCIPPHRVDVSSTDSDRIKKKRSDGTLTLPLSRTGGSPVGYLPVLPASTYRGAVFFYNVLCFHVLANCNHSNMRHKVIHLNYT